MEWILYKGWVLQDEIVAWLFNERDILVSQSTVSRILNRNRWTRKELRRISQDRSLPLRRLYLEEMSHHVQEDLVFLDESIFNEKTGWRSFSYGPIGSDGNERYANIQRGRTWSICAAYTVDGYLPCTGVREGYFNRAEFIDWLQRFLLPQLAIRNRPMVVVLDNVNIHVNTSIKDLIEAAGHLVQYLPPYSPDYNPIELTFSVLKAWMKRWYRFYRPAFEGGYGDFLDFAIAQSRCDRFAREHFNHAADGAYMTEEQRDIMEAEIQVYINAYGVEVDEVVIDLAEQVELE